MTDRPNASTITDAQLDELYNELDRLRASAAASPPGNWLLAGTRDMSIPQQAPRFTYRPVTPEMEQAATERARQAAEESEKTTRIFAALHRSAEDTVTRVISLYEQWMKAGPPPLGTVMARWWDRRLAELHGVIAEQSPRTTVNNSPTSGDVPDNPRQAAYDAVYAYIRSTSRMPGDLAYRNAMIWCAVNAALDAAGVPGRSNGAAIRELAIDLLDKGRDYTNSSIDSSECQTKAQGVIDASWAFAEAAGLPEDFDLRQIRDAAAEMAAEPETRHDDGPSIRESAANDRRWFDSERDGE